jgi:hypothetical protein
MASPPNQESEMICRCTQCDCLVIIEDAMIITQSSLHTVLSSPEPARILSTLTPEQDMLHQAALMLALMRQGRPTPRRNPRLRPDSVQLAAH